MNPTMGRSSEVRFVTETGATFSDIPAAMEVRVLPITEVFLDGESVKHCGIFCDICLLPLVTFPGLTEPYWALLGLTRPYWVLFCFTGPY